MVGLQLLIDHAEDLLLNLPCQAQFLCRLSDGTRRQIEINLVDDLTKLTLHVGHDDRLGKLLSIRLVPSIVFDLYVQIEGSLGAIHLLATLIWTDVASVDLSGSSPIVLLS